MQMIMVSHNLPHREDEMKIHPYIYQLLTLK
jgi:hypothetical protein